MVSSVVFSFFEAKKTYLVVDIVESNLLRQTTDLGAVSGTTVICILDQHALLPAVRRLGVFITSISGAGG